MSKSNRIQLSDHFTTGRLLKFTASPIIMMIFTSIYTIVDGFFVSNYAGKTAFTALNLIYPYLQMLGCLGFMIGTGGSALVAMTLGAGDEKRANRLFSMLAVATAVLGVLFSAFGLALLEPVAVLLGATPELLPSCLTVWPHSADVPDGVHAAVPVPELLYCRGKAQAGPAASRWQRVRPIWCWTSSL